MKINKKGCILLHPSRAVARHVLPRRDWSSLAADMKIQYFRKYSHKIIFYFACFAIEQGYRLIDC